MTTSEFEALQKTFPWTERHLIVGAGGLVQIIDRNGNEVPIFTMTEFLVMITNKLQLREDAKEAA